MKSVITPTGMLHLVTIAVLLGNAYAVDWPQYLGPTGDGSSPESVRTNWSQVAPREIWRQNIGPGFSSVAAVGTRLFTLVRRADQGTEREVCVSLDAETGDEVWSSDVDEADYDDNGYIRAMDGPRSTPSVDGDHVYVFTSRLKLICLRSSDGAQVWTRDFVAELNSQVISWQSAASPLVVGDLILINANANGQSLMAVRKSDGSTAWSGENDRMTHATPVVARIGETPQVIFLTRSGLVSVTPGTGDVLWRQAFQPNPYSTAASPVVAGDYVYATAAYASGAWGANVRKNGDQFAASLAWRQQGNAYQCHWSTPVAHEGFLYCVASPSSPQARLTCLDVKTGINRWTQTTVGSRSIGFGSIIKCANALVVLTEAGELVLVEASPSAYREIARKSVLSLYCWNHATLANGRLYARSTSANAQLVALDVAPVSEPLPPLELVAERGLALDTVTVTIRATDGTSLDSNQLGRVELLSTTDLRLPLEQWAVLQPIFSVRDGVGNMELPWDLGPGRFWQAREKAPGN